MFDMKNNSLIFICLKHYLTGGIWSNISTWYIYGFQFCFSALPKVCLSDGEDPDIVIEYPCLIWDPAFWTSIKGKHLLTCLAEEGWNYTMDKVRKSVSD